MKRKSKLISFTLFIIIAIYYFLIPIGREQRKKYAIEELDDFTHGENIDFKLLKGPICKAGKFKDEFIWTYNENNDTLFFYVKVPIIRILNTEAGAHDKWGLYSHIIGSKKNASSIIQ